MIVPKRLSPGENIGFVSPSSGLAPFAMHRIDNAKFFFESQGYGVKIPPNALKNAGYISASIEDRLKDIHDLFMDDSVGAVISTIGGNFSNQLLDGLDFELIKKNPKIFLGYSDITVLHWAIFSQSQLATYYGPCVMTQFGEYPGILTYTLESFEKAITSKYLDQKQNILASEYFTDEILDWFAKKDLERPRVQNINTGYQWWREGRADGFLLGGAIPSINHLAGTKYWVNPSGSIFFIDIPEGILIGEGLSIQDADAYLTDLYNLGVFEKINGLVIGRPYHYTPEQVEDLKNIILRVTNKKKCPILFNVNIGHVDPIITIRYGAPASIDSAANSFIVG